MTAALSTQPSVTLEEYYALEEKSQAKHEFRHGRIIAMAGADIQHVRIQQNVYGEARSALKGKPCESFNSDLRLRLSGKERTFYPDAMIICGEPRYDTLRDGSAGKSVINPRVIIEVLSDSTETYDRKEKFDLYRQIESLEEYILIAHNEPRIETYRRMLDGGWRFNVVTALESQLTISSVNITIPLAEIYAGVTFPSPPEPTPEPANPEE